MSHAEREDQDLQRALALSRGEVPPGQENGVTGTGQQFRPANTGFYPDNKWALTTTSHSKSREVFDDPPPSHRRRKPHEPAFLRPTPQSGHLSSLLLIYHAIPLAREALLLPSLRPISYGEDPLWWSGTRIQKPRTISLDQMHNENEDSLEVLHEVQRLMAFLDDTKRAYASVGALTEVDFYRDFDAEGDASRFLEVWQKAAMGQCSDDQLTQIFTSRAISNPTEADEEPTVKEFHCLDVPMKPFPGYSLYDVLDATVWPDHDWPDLDDTWLDNVAEIFTIRLHDPYKRADSLDLKVPAVWYPDRYIETMKHLSYDMRMRRLQLQMQIAELEKVQKRCSTQQGHGGQAVDIRSTLLAAASAAEVAVESHSMPNSMTDEFKSSASGNARISQAKGSDCARQLREVVERIDKKVQVLEDRKQQAIKSLQAVVEEFTKPSSDPSLPPFRKYTLRGVSTRPYTTYVLRPIVAHGDHETIDVGQVDSSERETKAWQWWRISFSRVGAQSTQSLPFHGPPTQAEAQIAAGPPFKSSEPPSDWLRKVRQPSQNLGDVAGHSIRKVREYEVLKAAREESNDSLLLVYANENAMKLSQSPLSAPLRRFVEADNTFFEQELKVDDGRDRDTAQSAERLAFSQYQPMQEMRVGSACQETLHDCEATPVSMTSPKREADGQPSPKRSKGYEESISPPN